MSNLYLGAEGAQYRLPFPDTVSGFDDLAITEANRAAFQTIRLWKSWQSSVMCLVGPVKCGLGIAGRLWAGEANAALLSARAFDALDIEALKKLAQINTVIDLADQVTNEPHLLTLLNLSQSNGVRVLLSARSGGANWGISSLDLKSRLEAMPVAEIYPPDEAMIVARLRASFKRRYIKLGDGTINFLAVRLPRSYEAIEDYVGRLDQAISDTGRAPSLHLARTVLEEGLSTRKLF